MAGGVSDGVYTYDIPLEDGGPRVPDANDLGGTEIQDGDPPPHKGAERSADMDNVQTATLAGLARMMPTCRLWIEWSGGTPSIVAIDSMGTLVEDSMFTLDPTGGPGVLNVAWPEGTLPAQNRPPRGWPTHGTGFVYAAAGTNELDVTMRNASNSAANINFALEIFG